MITERVQHILLRRRADGIFKSQTYDDKIYDEPEIAFRIRFRVLDFDAFPVNTISSPTDPVRAESLLRFNFMSRVYDKVWDRNPVPVKIKDPPLTGTVSLSAFFIIPAGGVGMGFRYNAIHPSR
ncbi:MAG TPA: hypothetical protein DCX27_19670 [Balneola sp.]|nr:hypothetical protein [Balneola sp.]